MLQEKENVWEKEMRGHRGVLEKSEAEKKSLH